MKILLKNATVFTNGKFQKTDVEVQDEKIAKIEENIESVGFDVVYDLKNMYLLPGLVDVHTHLREPGFIYKETIKTVKTCNLDYFFKKYHPSLLHLLHL